jgi:hypothetical protein
LKTTIRSPRSIQEFIMTFFSRMHNVEAIGGRMALTQGEIIELDRREALEIECLEGRLWITRAHDPEDYLLDAGEGITLESARGLVIEALRPSRLALATVTPQEEQERALPAYAKLAEAA